MVFFSHESRLRNFLESHCNCVELRLVQFVRIYRISFHIQLLLTFSLAASRAAAGALDAASAGGKVEEKHLKLAELGSVQLCEFLGVERDMMRITRESSAVIMET